MDSLLWLLLASSLVYISKWKRILKCENWIRASVSQFLRVDSLTQCETLKKLHSVTYNLLEFTFWIRKERKKKKQILFDGDACVFNNHHASWLLNTCTFLPVGCITLINPQFNRKLNYNSHMYKMLLMLVNHGAPFITISLAYSKNAFNFMPFTYIVHNLSLCIYSHILKMRLI